MSRQEAALRESELASLSRNVDDVSLVKASQAAAMVVDTMMHPIDSLAPPADMGEWLDLYSKHVWAYAGVFAVASTVAKLKRKVVRYDRKTRESEDDWEHPILYLLDYPNPQMTGYDLLEKDMIRLELTGNAYDEIVWADKTIQQEGKTVKSSRGPAELWSIRPDYVTPIPSAEGKGTDHYIFQVKRYARKKTFKLEQILRVAYVSPTDDVFGLGRLNAAIDDIRQDKAMAAWNLDFFEHGMSPEGVFTTDKVLLPSEAKNIAEQIKEFLVGRTRKVLVLGKNLKWDMISANPKDVDFLQGRRDNCQAVLAALGVPPVKVGLLEHAKYDNYRLQTDAFHRDTILPKLRKLEGAYNLFLVPKYPDLARTPGKDFRVEFDTEELLAEDRDKLSSRVISQFTNGLLTVNEALEMLGYDTVEDEALGSLRIIGGQFQPLENVASGAGGGGPVNALEGREQQALAALESAGSDVTEKVEEAVKKALEERGL